MCGCEHLFAIESKYWELIWAVETKYPDESRHETALRYIKEAENRGDETAKQDLKFGHGHKREKK